MFIHYAPLSDCFYLSYHFVEWPILFYFFCSSEASLNYTDLFILQKGYCQLNLCTIVDNQLLRN